MDQGSDTTRLIPTSMAQSRMKEIINGPRSARPSEKDDLLRDPFRTECQQKQPVMDDCVRLETGSLQPSPFSMRTERTRQYFFRLLQRVLDAAEAHPASRHAT
jgi:hypothetical protein